MKRLVTVLVVALAAGFLSGTWYLRHRTSTDALGDELAWLQKEFALDARQFSAVEQLHAVYQPVCDRHCDEYLRAHQRLTRILEHSRAYPPEADAALDALFDVQKACQRDLLKHGYAVAALMSPEQGARYLAMIQARVLAHDPPEMRHRTP